jgi:hypothetical protein
MAANQRPRSTAALLHNNVAAGNAAYQPSKLQPQPHMVQPDTMAAPGYYHVDYSQMLAQQQQQQQPQQYYADASLLQQQQVMASAGAAQDYSAVQPAPQPQYAAWPHLAPLQVKQEQEQPQQPGLLSPFDQQAKHPWDAITAADGAAELAGDAATAAPATSSLAWIYSSDTQQHQQQQQQQQIYKTEQQDHQDQGQQQSAAAAAGQMLAPAPLQPKQEQQPKQEADGRSLSPAKGRPLPLELPTDPYAHFLRSPLGIMSAQGMLMSPGGMLNPLSCHSVGRPSFSQLDLFQLTPGDAATWHSVFGQGTSRLVAAAGAAAAGADAAYSNPRSARPSDNGGSLASALACCGALGAAPRTGTKRGRSSQTSVDDEAAMLIHAPATKVARGGEAPAEGGLYGCDNPWEEGFLPKFE